MPKYISKECLCGCGEQIISPDSRGRERNWKSGHNGRVQLVGKKLSEETKQKIRLAHTGKKLSEEHKEKIGKSGKGVSGRKRTGNSMASLVAEVRSLPEYQEWRKGVKERDGEICHWCGKENIPLETDHIIPLTSLLKNYSVTTWQMAKNTPELWDITNGRILCKDCHRKTHTYGNNKKKKPIFSMVIPCYTITKELEEMAYFSACVYRPFVDELIIVEDGGNFSPRLLKIANSYIYRKNNGGFTKAVNTGWDFSQGDFTAIASSDTHLTKGNLRDLCVPHKVTSPEISNQYIERLAGPFFVVPKEIKEERGLLLEGMRTYSSDSEYDHRVKDIFQKVPEVVIFHHQAQTVKAAGVEGAEEQQRDREVYQKLIQEGKAAH